LRLTAKQNGKDFLHRKARAHVSGIITRVLKGKGQCSWGISALEKKKKINVAARRKHDSVGNLAPTSCEEWGGWESER